jgi:polysaccharide deacetylase family protein (PEP-CTERM system associated)
VTTTLQGADSGAALLRHGLSFDIECYYQIVAKDFLGRRLAPTAEAERNTEWILEALARAGVKGTFFTLGNMARAFPDLVRRIAAEGHELALHGDEHHYITRMTPGQFKAEIARGMKAIEDASGVRVKGHRAPAFSIVKETIWALDVLRELGFAYDSSIFPIKGRRYGIPDAPRRAWRLVNGLVEVPMTAIDIRGRARPAAGGGYVRHFPYAFTHRAMARCAAEGRPAITYFHPHEFQAGIPRISFMEAPLSPTMRLRLLKNALSQGHGRGPGMRRKFERLLAEFAFEPIGAIAASVG